MTFEDWYRLFDPGSFLSEVGPFVRLTGQVECEFRFSEQKVMRGSGFVPFTGERQYVFPEMVG